MNDNDIRIGHCPNGFTIFHEAEGKWLLINATEMLPYVKYNHFDPSRHETFEVQEYLREPQIRELDKFMSLFT